MELTRTIQFTRPEELQIIHAIHAQTIEFVNTTVDTTIVRPLLERAYSGASLTPRELTDMLIYTVQVLNQQQHLIRLIGHAAGEPEHREFHRLLTVAFDIIGIPTPRIGALTW